ncbi:DUF998 domain-containing protein, partial [Amycolatopsis rhizosphaerae]|uniref:DUF998 domain-containing protein n=1 Tax=Amycolatopsis rhizosphaerae TaxID=2053003 RepID=UPI00319E0D88
VLPSPARTDPLARMLAWAGHGAFAVAATLLVVLHLDPDWGGGENPVTAMLSEYALTPGHWAWALALTLTSAGSVAVLVSLRRTGVLAGAAAPAWLAVWCVAIALVAVFSKDPQGGAVSLTGKLHLYATGVSCAALPVAGLVLARTHRAHPSWHRFARWSRWLALASVPFFLPFIVPFAVHVLFSRGFPTPATGLVERIMAGLELALLALLGGWAHHASRSMVHTGHPAEISQADQREQLAP